MDARTTAVNGSYEPGPDDVLAKTQAANNLQRWCTTAWEIRRRIDYIFVRCDDYGPTLDIRGCERLFARPIDGVWASDHFGVAADLAVSAREYPFHD